MWVLANLAVSVALLSLILVIQLVHYPSFHFYDAQKFIEGMIEHQRRISLVVVPLMLLEVIIVCVLAVGQRSPATIASLILVAAVWLITFLVQVPLHQKLLAGQDVQAVDSLVRGNWWRVGLWAAKTGVALFLILQSEVAMSSLAKNVLGGPLQLCCQSPKTGFYRDGFCHTGPTDHGTHVACATVTEEFLTFTKSKGNDLSTPRPEWNFPGLKPGDKWCLCALRWLEAKRAGVAPKLDLSATHEKMLEYANLRELQE